MLRYVLILGSFLVTFFSAGKVAEARRLFQSIIARPAVVNKHSVRDVSPGDLCFLGPIILDQADCRVRSTDGYAFTIGELKLLVVYKDINSKPLQEIALPVEPSVVNVPLVPTNSSMTTALTRTGIEFLLTDVPGAARICVHATAILSNPDVTFHTAIVAMELILL